MAAKKKVAVENIPSELRALNQWVVWADDKIPYNVLNEHKASVTRPDDWTSFDLAVRKLHTSRKWKGLGFVLTEDDGLVGVDFDNGLNNPQALSIVSAIGSYTEVSPSGDGLKTLAFGSLDRAKVDHKRGLEMYAKGRYFTITGNIYDNLCSIKNAKDEIQQLADSFPARVINHAFSDYIAQRVPTDVLLSKAFGSRSGEKFRALWEGNWSSVNEQWSASEADAALCAMIAFWTGPDVSWIADVFRESGLYRPEKWEREDYRASTIALAVSELKTWYQWYQNGSSSDQTGDLTDTVHLQVDDFLAYLPTHKYIYLPSRQHWPAASVNSQVPPMPSGTNHLGQTEYVAANKWLDEHRKVHAMTWAPGEPLVIEGRIVTQGGWHEHPGVKTFNQYMPSTLPSNREGDVTPWLDLVDKIYGSEGREHLVRWFAHRVQRPWEKINHAIVLGGAQGIGKDTILEPIRLAIGPWNFADISPVQLLGRFNPFVRSVVLRISEARDLGDVDRYKFYEHLKVYTAAPPEVMLCDQKFADEHYVLNVCGVMITTNHKEGGLYLPADDRRHYVLWSDARSDDFDEGYWRWLWNWYVDGGGFEAVKGYLESVSLGGFDPKEPPVKTSAFWSLVSSSLAPEDSELADVLDRLGWPDVVTIDDLLGRADYDLEAWLRDRRNARKIPHRMEELGYARANNPMHKDGRWKVSGRNKVVYVSKGIPERERLNTVRGRIDS